MKSIYTINLFIKTITITVLFSSILFSQVPNSGFENWTNGNPDNWETTNNDQVLTITPSNDAHSGSFSAQGAVTSISGFSFSPVLLTHFANSGRPTNLKGYYKFTSVGSDTFYIVISLYKNSEGIGGGIFTATANTDSYTEFNAAINYNVSDNPDSAAIGISIRPAVNSHTGSMFLVDDLSLINNPTDAAADKLQIPEAFGLEQNYPNPFNPETQIKYQIPKQTRVSLKVYDLLGNKIASLVDEELPAGFYSVKFNGSSLSSGIYFYRIEAGDFSATKKFLLLK